MNYKQILLLIAAALTACVSCSIGRRGDLLDLPNQQELERATRLVDSAKVLLQLDEATQSFEVAQEASRIFGSAKSKNLPYAEALMCMGEAQLTINPADITSSYYYDSASVVLSKIPRRNGYESYLFQECCRSVGNYTWSLDIFQEVMGSGDVTSASTEFEQFAEDIQTGAPQLQALSAISAAKSLWRQHMTESPIDTGILVEVHDVIKGMVNNPATSRVDILLPDSLKTPNTDTSSQQVFAYPLVRTSPVFPIYPDRRLIDDLNMWLGYIYLIFGDQMTATRWFGNTCRFYPCSDACPTSRPRTEKEIEALIAMKWNPRDFPPINISGYRSDSECHRLLSEVGEQNTQLRIELDRASRHLERCLEELGNPEVDQAVVDSLNLIIDSLILYSADRKFHVIELLALADTCFRRRDYQCALDFLDMILSENPANTDALNLKGDIQKGRDLEIVFSLVLADSAEREKLLGKALEAYLRILQLDSIHTYGEAGKERIEDKLEAQRYAHRALQLYVQGYPAAAQTALDSAVVKDASLESVRNFLVGMHSVRADSTSLDDIEKDSTVYPYYLSGMEFNRKREYQQAIDAFNEVLKYYPNSPAVLKKINEARQMLINPR